LLKNFNTLKNKADLVKDPCTAYNYYFAGLQHQSNIELVYWDSNVTAKAASIVDKT
jgi:hypothetical protein